MTRRLDKRAVAEELAVGFDSHFESWREVLLEQVRALQAASTPSEFFDLHLDVLARFAARQDVATERRARAEALRAEHAALVVRAPKPIEAMKEVQQKVQILKELDRRDAVLQHIARCIVDGIAWRVLRADRRAIAVLGEGERVGRLADEKGFDAELKQLAELWEKHGLFAIHNDITNCLRHADLTVFVGSWPDPDVGFMEVKAGGIVRTTSPQYQRLEQKLQLLRTNFDPVGAAGEPLRLHRLAIPYRTHLGVLPELIARARRNGVADAQVEECFVVSVLNYMHFRGRETDIGDWYGDAPRRLGWTPGDDRHFVGSSLVRRMNERQRQAPSSYLAPVALFPLPAEDVVDILMGRIEYSVTLNAAALEREFAERGITARCAGDPEWDEVFLWAARGDYTLTVPAHLREQKLQELMTSEALIDIVKARLDQLEAGASADEKSMLFWDEHSAWPPLG